MPIAGEIQAFLILTVPLRQAATPVVISTVAMAVDAVSREVVSGNNREKIQGTIRFSAENGGQLAVNPYSMWPSTHWVIRK
jgi:hypothetical protein